MITVHMFWVLIMIAAAYLIGMIVGWRFTVEDPPEDKPMAIKKDFVDDDYMQEVYGDVPNWLKRQAD